MPGITGPTWWYCDFVLELDDKSLLLLVPGDTRIIDKVTSDHRPLESSDTDVEKTLGQPIVDVVEVDDWPMVLVLLSNGRYIESSLQPGGSYLGVNAFSNWEADELQTSFYRSLVDGRSGPCLMLANDEH